MKTHIRPIFDIPYPIVHRARRIIADSQTTIQNGFIKVVSGIITEIGQGKNYGTDISTNHVLDHGHGVILPALVNAHTHLEFCALKGKISFENGFQDWVRHLIQQREVLTMEEIISGAKNGIQELSAGGCGIIGEISSLGLTWEIFSNAGIAGVWFREFLGEMNLELPTSHLADVGFRSSTQPTSKSLAGHAPHTTSPNLLVELKHAAQKARLPFSIHLAESEDEMEFLCTGKGKWAEFLTERGINYADWGLPVKSPVQYLDKMGILDEKTLAVHLIHAVGKDYEILSRRNVNVCLCLRSNQNLHNQLPDIEKMYNSGINLCLGTDSLASTDSLSMFDEMAFVAQHFPAISPGEILKMATENGAKALGMEKQFGTLAPGKYAAFVVEWVE